MIVQIIGFEKMIAHVILMILKFFSDKRLFHREVTKRWPNGEIPYILRYFQDDTRKVT